MSFSVSCIEYVSLSPASRMSVSVLSLLFISFYLFCFLCSRGVKLFPDAILEDALKMGPFDIVIIPGGLQVCVLVCMCMCVCVSHHGPFLAHLGLKVCRRRDVIACLLQIQTFKVFQY